MHVLFDLDGTLTDPKLGFVRSVRYALTKLNIEFEPDTNFESYIGPLFMTHLEYYVVMKVLLRKLFLYIVNAMRKSVYLRTSSTKEFRKAWNGYLAQLNQFML